MLKRLYVNNYKTLINFDFKIDSDEYYKHSALFIGKNGAGKTSIAEVLQIFQKIGKGQGNLLETEIGNNNSTIPPIVSNNYFSFNQTNSPMEFELEAEIENHNIKYLFSLELKHSTFLSVKREQLFINGNRKFDRNEADISLKDDQINSFKYDWHSIYFPIYQDKDNKQNCLIKSFKEWLKNMVIISPIPKNMQSKINNKSLFLQQDASNITDWYSYVVGENPDDYGEIKTKYLLHVFPDFEKFHISSDDYGNKNLNIVFRNGKKDISISFDMLSDGEKCLILAAFILIASKVKGNIFCFWDEPDNYLAISEVEYFIATLQKFFLSAGQIFMTTHNPEVMLKFPEDKTYRLYRSDHLSPARLGTIAEWRKDNNFEGNIINAWINGDLDE